MRLHVLLALAALVIGFVVPTLAQEQTTGTPVALCSGFSLADQASHSHPRGDFGPYRALFFVSCAHP